MTKNELDLGIFLREMQDEMIGYVLDLARVSPMGDRQFQQFERSIKKYIRETFNANLEVIKDYDAFKVSDKQTFLDTKNREAKNDN